MAKNLRFEENDEINKFVVNLGNLGHLQSVDKIYSILFAKIKLQRKKSTNFYYTILYPLVLFHEKY